ncbi:unnamed protein product [Mucor hiemalis]
MTYPSDWTPKQVEYLRSLVQLAGVVSEHDHPDRLLMYSEGASILRALQDPTFSSYYNRGDFIKSGYKYLICDVGGSKVKMNTYIMKLPPGTSTDIKVEYKCDWDENYTKLPARLLKGTHNLHEQCKEYLLSNFFTFKYLDDQRREDFEELVNNVILDGSKELSKRTIEKNDLLIFHVPTSLVKFFNSQLHRFDPATLLSQKVNFFGEDSEIEDTAILAMQPTELERNVFKPVCEEIVNYFENILKTVGESVDAIIFSGGFCFQNT